MRPGEVVEEAGGEVKVFELLPGVRGYGNGDGYGYGYGYGYGDGYGYGYGNGRGIIVECG